MKSGKREIINGFLLFFDVKDSNGFVLEEQRNRINEIVKLLKPRRIESLKEALYLNPEKGIKIISIRNKEFIGTIQTEITRTKYHAMHTSEPSKSTRFKMKRRKSVTNSFIPRNS